jgi:hypothetical protein
LHAINSTLVEIKHQQPCLPPVQRALNIDSWH